MTPGLLADLLAAALSLGLWVVFIGEANDALTAPPLETLLLV